MAGEIKRGPVVAPMRPRILLTVVRASGLLPMTVSFGVLFLMCATIVTGVEPGIASLGDAAWFLFTVVTTIGLGDYTCTTLVGRVVTVVLSVYSVFFLALITGAVVSYCSERIKAQRDESIAAFVDKLRRLPELSHEELVELSERISKMR